MTAKRILDRKSVRVQMTLDSETLKRLDMIIELCPDLNSRSAAIRWAARIGLGQAEAEAYESGRMRFSDVEKRKG